MNAAPRGLIFDIQGFSLHDGPGARTTVFMSGCPLACSWCCNPEGLSPEPVLLRRESRCVRCGRCVAHCPRQAIRLGEDGEPRFKWDLCHVCQTHDCIHACWHEALTESGRLYSVEDLLKVLRRDRPFWGSRGGVTFSGGEPLSQPAFLRAVLSECEKESVDTCIETTALAPREIFLELTGLTDWAFIDIKQMDSVRHRLFTGVANERILENIRALGASSWSGFAVVRIPLIPGCNDSEENLRATARFVKDVGLEVIHLLPFHRLGESKYSQLGKVWPFPEIGPPAPRDLERAKRFIEDEGVVCFVGHATPF